MANARASLRYPGRGHFENNWIILVGLSGGEAKVTIQFGCKSDVETTRKWLPLVVSSPFLRVQDINGCQLKNSLQMRHSNLSAVAEWRFFNTTYRIIPRRNLIPSKRSSHMRATVVRFSAKSELRALFEKKKTGPSIQDVNEQRNVPTSGRLPRDRMSCATFKPVRKQAWFAIELRYVLGKGKKLLRRFSPECSVIIGSR